VNAIRLWRQAEGQSRYPDAARLLIVCDAGGASDWRSHLRKDQLAVLAAGTGLRTEVMHFPPGTSKWNKTGHRLFCHVTRTWRARPLMTAGDAVAGIAATVTSEGLKCTAVRDYGDYPEGVKVPAGRVKYLQDRVTERAAFHGEWNYAFLPRPRPAPDPEAGPSRPDRVPAGALSHPALTGMQPQDLAALAAALDVPFEAGLCQRNYNFRKGPRANAARSTAPHASRKPGITGCLLALALRRHLELPGRAIGTLPGAGQSTANGAVALAGELLTAARLPLPAAPPPDSIPRTPGELLDYAAAAGIPLTIPESRYSMPEHFRTRTKRTIRTIRDTHEAAN
jgi:hypothetical protein